MVLGKLGGVKVFAEILKVVLAACSANSAVLHDLEEKPRRQATIVLFLVWNLPENAGVGSRNRLERFRALGVRPNAYSVGDNQIAPQALNDIGN